MYTVISAKLIPTPPKHTPKNHNPKSGPQIAPPKKTDPQKSQPQVRPSDHTPKLHPKTHPKSHPQTIPPIQTLNHTPKPILCIINPSDVHASKGCVCCEDVLAKVEISYI